MDLGIIGNCSYNALIDSSGSIKWLCWPRFDSSFVFGSLLDSDHGGSFAITSAHKTFRTTQEYVRNTNVLKTIVKARDGEFEIIDFAPRFLQNDREFRPTSLFRIVTPLSGKPQIQVTCQPKYDYGNITPTRYVGSHHIAYEGFPSHIRLTTNASLSYVDSGTPFSLNEPLYFCFSWGQPLEAPLKETAENFLERTISYWRRWVKHCALPEKYQEEVIRSALVLKLHQYEDTGAIIAASTTSIPEGPGTNRNWDYRFCWLRDSYFTLSALRNLGQFEELESFVDYLSNLAARNTGGRLQPVFGIGLEEELHESIVDHLKGYQGHQPVRIGNAAYEHIQNDVYGEMLLAISPLFLDSRFVRKSKGEDLHLIEDLLLRIEKTLTAPDAGLWEFRGLEQIHTFTLLLHWLGARDALEIALKYSVNKLAKRAERILKKTSSLIEKKSWKKSLGCYSQATANTALDAALFCMVNLGYLNPQNPRTRSHVRVLRKKLSHKDGLLYRYRHSDDFGVPKTTFTICGFWAAEALARIGDINAAHQLFEQLIDHRNHLGLLSEDIDPSDGALWGNFPQTYSHVGLINAAFEISRQEPVTRLYGDSAANKPRRRTK